MPAQTTKHETIFEMLVQCPCSTEELSEATNSKKQSIRSFVSQINQKLKAHDLEICRVKSMYYLKIKNSTELYTKIF